MELAADEDDWDEDFGTFRHAQANAYRNVLAWLGGDAAVWRWRSMGDDDKFLALLKGKARRSDEELERFDKPGYGSESEREYELGWNDALLWCLARYRETAKELGDRAPQD